MIYVMAATGAYLLGSIPFGYLAGRLCGVDVRQYGSGNIGATNVLRVLGGKLGYPVFLADALKGFLAVRLAFSLSLGTPGLVYRLGIVAAICAVLGHSFPIWLGFRGGKGVATSAGAWLGLMPIAILIAMATWIAVFLLLRLVSLASVVAAIVLPVSVWLLTRHHANDRVLLVSFSAVLAGLVILRHRDNLRRLAAGTEPRFQRK